MVKENMRKAVASLTITALMAGAVVPAAMAAPVQGLAQARGGSSMVIEARSHRGRAAAVGVAAGAAVALGILALGQANAEPREVYVTPPPPPPPPVSYDRGYVPDDDESPREAIEACRYGLVEASRPYGAWRVNMDDVINIRPTEDGGHKIRAMVSIFYPGHVVRTSEVVCRTRDGALQSARAVGEY